MEHASRISHLATPSFGIGRALARAFVWVEAVFRTLRERRELMSLDDGALKDIGISRADADREWSRPFWDVAG